MKKKFYSILSRNVFVFLIASCWLINTSTAQVSLTASAGTTAGTYTNLSSAFSAINSGTHQGSIVIDISASFTESVNAVLNSSGSGSCSYSSVIVRPVSDAITLSFATATGRGIIELNGADNVTIDGDNPNTPGINRNLTITNTAAATTTFTSVIRVATGTVAPYLDCNNISIQNLFLNGSATTRNAAGITASTTAANNTYGVVAGPNGGATITALTSVTASMNSSAVVNTFLVNNCAINQCGRGVSFLGNNTASSTGISIINNEIGDHTTTNTGAAPFTSPATTVYVRGIIVQGTNAVNIAGNSIKNILSYCSVVTSAIELTSAIGTGTVNISNNTIHTLAQNNTTANAVRAILISNSAGSYTISNNTITNIQGIQTGIGAGTIVAGIEVNSSAPSGTIELNKITKVHSRNPGTTGAYGLHLAGGNNVTVKNNFITDINQNVTGGFATFSEYCAVGIRIASGTGHNIYYNSVNLFGSFIGTFSTDVFSACLAITSTTITGLNIRNNIFSNTLTAGGLNSANVCLLLPSSATSAMNLTLNNNAYFTASIAGVSGVAMVGNSYVATPTAAGAGLYTAGNFNAALTIPISNLRAYTSILSAAGTNDNSSVASIAAAPFVSATDLHIDNTAATAVDIESKGAVIAGVTMDIDGDIRNITTPDIGADEFMLPNCAVAIGGVVAPATATVCAGNTYTMTATGATAGTGITYQWEFSPTGGGAGFVNVAAGTGSNTTTFTTGTLMTPGTYYYRLNVTCSFGAITSYSNEVIVTVTPSGATGTVSGPVAGETYQSLIYTVAGYNVGSTFQWQMTTTAGGTYTNIIGANTDTYIALHPAAGTYYYRVVITNSSCSIFSNEITTVITVAGDNVCNAIPLILGINGPFTNVGATIQTGEMMPTLGSCTGQTSWCGTSGGINNSVWFTFIAPPSGRVSLHFLPGNWDSEIAVYESSSCGALLTGGATLLAANDDSVSSTLNAYISALCVTPGTMYYVQVDGYTTTTHAAFHLLLKDEGNIAPVITGCPANITMPASTGLCTAVANWTAPTVTDCAPFTLTSSHTPGSVFPIGTTTVTYTASDVVNPPVLCSFTVTVVDNEMPVVSSCPSNMTIQANSTGCTATATWVAPVATDNCGIVTSTSTHAIGSSFPLGTTTVTYSLNDGNGNIATCSFNVTVINNLSTSVITTNALCNGAANGNIDITVTGGTAGFTFDWDNDGTGDNDDLEDISVGAGTYNVIITDANGCTTSTSVTVTEPPAITALAVTTNVSCNGGNDGMIDLFAFGGTGAFTFDWDNDGTGDNDDTEDLTASAGVYAVIITDANGCTFTSGGVISEPSPIVVSSTVTNTSCGTGASDGMIDITTTGGTPGYTFDWDNDGTGDNDDTEDLNSLTAGTYALIVIDDNGCTTTHSYTITTATAVVFNNTTTICNGESITVGSNTYSTSGVYTDVFTGGAANGCDSTVVTNLTVNPAINTATTLISVSITASATSGTYQWIDCNNGNTPITGATLQTYTATVNGDYAVIITQLGCADTSACVNIDGVGFSEINNGFRFLVYPNPSTGMFTIESGSNAKAIVLNMLGEQIQSLAIYKGNNQLNLDAVASGPYTLRIEKMDTGEVLDLQRLLIQK